MSTNRRPQSRRRRRRRRRRLLLPRLLGGVCVCCGWLWFWFHNNNGMMFRDANDMDHNAPSPAVVVLSNFLQELNMTQGRVCGKQKCFFESSTNSTTGYLMQDTSSSTKNNSMLLFQTWDMAYRLDQQWKQQYDSYKSYYLPHQPPFVVHVDSGKYVETLNTQFPLVKTNKGGPPMMFSNLSNDKLVVQPVQKAATTTSMSLLLGCSRTKYKPALKQIPDYCQRQRQRSVHQPMQYQTLLQDWKWIQTTIMDANPHDDDPALWLLNHDFQVMLEDEFRLVHLDIDRVFELVPPHLPLELLLSNNNNNSRIAWETVPGVPQRPKIQACRANMQTLIDRIGKECFSIETIAE